VERILRTLAWMGLALAILSGLAFIFVEPFNIPLDDAPLAASLEPNLHAGDALLVTRSKGATYGHLVRCPDPTPGRDRWMVGRVVGTPGQVFNINNERVTRRFGQEPSRSCDVPTYPVRNPANGVIQNLQCRAEDIGRGIQVLYGHEGPPITRTFTVEPSRVFLVSDNRHFPNDSTTLGQVNPDTCQTIVMRLWSKEGWGDDRNRFNVLY
jgi:signal peptidase I